MSVCIATKGRVLFLGTGIPAELIGVSAEDIHNIIRKRFEDLVLANIIGGCPTQYDNAPFEKPQDSKWIRVTIRIGETKQASISSAKRFRTTGVALSQVFTPIEEGDQQGLEIADLIQSAFRSVNDSGVTFRSPTIQKVGRQSDEWQINVICPFYADSLEAA